MEGGILQGYRIGRNKPHREVVKSRVFVFHRPGLFPVCVGGYLWYPDDHGHVIFDVCYIYRRGVTTAGRDGSTTDSVWHTWHTHPVLG